jgi:hypothetical protein
MARIHGKLVVYLECQVCGKRRKVNVGVKGAVYGQDVQGIIVRKVQEKGWDIFNDNTEKHTKCSLL